MKQTIQDAEHDTKEQSEILVKIFTRLPERPKHPNIGAAPKTNTLQGNI